MFLLPIVVTFAITSFRSRRFHELILRHKPKLKIFHYQ